jgi:hypothetical protein
MGIDLDALRFPPTEPPDPALAGNLVEARFGMSTDLVDQYDVAAETAIAALSNMDYSIPMSNIDLSGLSVPPPNIGDAPAPTVVGAYETQAQLVEFPDIAALRDALGLVEATVDQVTLPTLGVTSPFINLPDAPTDTLPTVPTDMPTVSDPTIPATPSLDMPPVPVLEQITLPLTPSIDNLTFEGTMPTADLTPPEPMFVYTETTYQSDLADAIKTKLYNDVTLGGTGLTPEVEQAIWDRAITRLNIELAKTYQQTLNNWAAWNIEMPDGVLSSALQEVLFDADRNRLDLDRDIMVKQAELAQQNTQFAITSGLVYEKQMMDFINQMNMRAFEAAKYRFTAIIDGFRLKVEVYLAQMEGYKVLAQVFESRIRAELAKVELFKAQMDGAKIQGELQVQQVAIYTARVQALNTVIDLYRAQMDGAKLQIEVDRAKIDAARARIDAVKAQIDGVTAKYNLYQAQLAGETTKVDLYGKQVNAYATQVSAVKTEADISIAMMQAQMEANKDKLAVLSAAIEQYKADTQYELGKDDTGAKVYTAQMSGYTAEVGREGEYLRAQIDTFKARITEIAATAELTIKEMDANLRAAAAAKEMQMEALKAVSSIYTQKVASALTSVSASAQIGFNASVSDAYTQSASSSSVKSTALQQQQSEVHQYIYQR